MTAACASAAALLVAVVLVSARVMSLAGLALLVAMGFGSYARHWLGLAGRSRVGARSDDEVRCHLSTLERDGWRLRHSLPWRGSGDIDSVAIAPSGIAFAIETKTRATRLRTSPGCTSRRSGCRAAASPVDFGLSAAAPAATVQGID
jgi:hypothetical protein